MKILVINAGSSSLKYQLIDMENQKVLAKGLAERIGIDGSNLKQKADGKVYESYANMPDHVAAMNEVMHALLDEENGPISSTEEITAVGHRVVHGGEKFSASVVINEDVLECIRENIPLAPLHNPANIQGIEACQKVVPHAPMVAVFDTAFHQTMPAHSYLYGLPREFYTDYQVRRYGFHGTSHKFVANRMAELLGKPIEDLKIVTCHLGNGGSVAAVLGGKSVDTSMGLTPLEGLMMGTRCGDIDPAIIQYLCRRMNKTVDEVTDILNKKSGVLGLSGLSSDMRDIENAVNEGNMQATEAQDAYTYRIRKYIGAYAAAMDGLDAIVFTAGVGENDHMVREKSMRGLSYLGAAIDVEKNKAKDTRGNETDLSAEGSRVRVWLIPTNEELAIARDTEALVK